MAARSLLLMNLIRGWGRSAQGFWGGARVEATRPKLRYPLHGIPLAPHRTPFTEPLPRHHPIVPHVLIGSFRWVRS